MIHIYKRVTFKEKFNSQKFETNSQSLNLSGGRTDLPLLVLHGNFTNFKSPFPFELHSFGDWFICILAADDDLWPAQADPFGHPRLEDVLCDLVDKVGGESLGGEYLGECV